MSVFAFHISRVDVRFHGPLCVHTGSAVPPRPVRTRGELILGGFGVLDHLKVAHLVVLDLVVVAEHHDLHGVWRFR